MKEFYSQIDKKLYYIVVLLMIVLMLIGLLVDNPRFGEFQIGFILHSVLVIVVMACLLLYPKYESHVFRTIIIIASFGYFYTIFILFPEAGSTFILLCLIPAISILLFDSKLFYFSLILNTLLIMVIFAYVVLIDQGELYPYLLQDLLGNIINFIASQLIIYLIYYLSDVRLKKLKLYYEQIEQSERLKVTGQLAAAVAHEIRNPMTVVKGFLQFYEKDTSINNDVKRHFSLMIDELNAAEQVISQYLSLAKPSENQKTETINIEVVLKSITELLQSYGLLHNNKLDLKVEANSYIAANTLELKQLFINIIKNAIEVSEVGKSIIIKAERKKNFVEIKVIDYGFGMSEDEVKCLGTPFYSLKRKGTGLGLMICFNIIEKYNGYIDFESLKGEGTTVTVSFPAKEKESMPDT